MKDEGRVHLYRGQGAIRPRSDGSWQIIVGVALAVAAYALVGVLVWFLG